MEISLALHIVGVVMWLGSLLVLTRMLSACEEGEIASPFSKITKKVYFGWTLGGLTLTLLTGLYQFFVRGASYYMKSGWFHGKLTFLIVLIILTVLVARPVKMVSNGENVHQSKMMMFHGITGLCLIAIVFLTMVGRVHM